MIGKKHYYKSDEISVTFEPKLCIHAAECVKGLPEVFDAKKKPWIEPDKAAADKIADVIKRCPSGALKYEMSSGANELIEEYDPTIKVKRNGPIYFRGNIDLYDTDGNKIGNQGRIALCRCGASKNKPFCDNTHKEIKFNAG